MLPCNAGVEAWGTLAEQVVVPADSLVPIPPGWSAEEMAGAPLVFLTAWQALTQWNEPPAPPVEGSVLLVTGRLGRRRSGVCVARPVDGSHGRGVVAKRRKVCHLKALGADVVLDPSDPHLRTSVNAAIAPKKVGLVIDSVGGPLFDQLVAILGYRGRISVVGRSAGAVPNFNTATLLFRRSRIGGVAVSDYTPEAGQAAWKEIVSRLAAIGRRPVVDGIFSFEEVKPAFARLQQGPMGKVVVRIAG